MPTECSSPRLFRAALAALLVCVAGGLRTHKKPPSYKSHGTDWREGQCAQRDKQSPISIDRLLKAPPSEDVEFWYKPIQGADLTMTASGGLLYVDLSQQLWGGVAYNNKWYPLVRIDFHGKSEHRLKGKQYPLEIQLVHREQSDPRESLILSLLVWSEVDPPPPNPAKKKKAYKLPDPKQMDFNPSLQNFLLAQPPSQEGATSTLKIPASPPGPPPPGSPPPSPPLDLAKLVANPLVNGSDVYMSYAGSHTSPPCYGRTQWFIRRLSVTASNQQVKALSDALYTLTFGEGNFRSIMPLNQRGLTVTRFVQRIAMKVDEDRSLNWGTNPRTDGEYQAQQQAVYADQQAQRSSLYIEDFARRLGASDVAYANALTKTTTWMPFEATAEGKATAYAASVMRVRQAIMGAAREAQKAVDVNMRWQAGQITAATLAHEAWAGALTAQAVAATPPVAAPPAALPR